MTFEKFAYDYLFNNGMFEDDAKKVIELAKKDEVLGDTMNNSIASIFLISLNYIAVKYIDETIPKAWFRSIFAGE